MNKVTIIITTYNRPKFLKYAIKSALMQTYKDTEVIVVDDNSNYDVSKFLRSFQNEIMIIKNKKNIGTSASKNIGIKESSGDYITFLDDDDIFHPKKIDRQIKLFNNKKIGLVYCPMATKINDKLVYKKLKNKNNYWIRITHQNHIGISPLIKKECFSECGIFDESMDYHEDRDLWYRIGKKFQFALTYNPDYIWYNLKIDRLSVDVDKIYKNKIKLYEKHKNDFDDKSSYFSDLNSELAYIYFLFKDYKKFFEFFKKSIALKTKILPKVLKNYIKTAYENIDRATKISYKKIEIDKGIKDILS